MADLISDFMSQYGGDGLLGSLLGGLFGKKR